MATKKSKIDFIFEALEKEVWTKIILYSCTEEQLEKHKDNVDWNEISALFPWTEEQLEKYKDKIDWSEVSRNLNMKWSNTMLERFKHLWDWEELSRINDEDVEKILYTEENLIRYKDYWDWQKLSKTMPNIELVDKFVDQWDWEAIFDNSTKDTRNIKNKEFVYKYIDYIPIISLFYSDFIFDYIYEEEYAKIEEEINSNI
ncbi:MAG TPA: hypothetical protein PKW37_02425 [Salinivirgaceae bacterium]|nr:hypothetical protein [Salinivirgaceae bacterium]